MKQNEKTSPVFSTYALVLLHLRLVFLAHQSWCRLLVRYFPDLPVVSLACLLVGCTRVEPHFSVLFQTLKELHRMLIAFLLQEMHKHNLEIQSFAVFGEMYVNRVDKLSIQSNVECISHIGLVVMSRNAWNAH